MAIQCENCGKELFAGQRFCRYCGKPSGEFQEEKIPTQMMPPDMDPHTSRRQADTAPQVRPRTEPVYTPPQPGYYQPSLGGPPMPPVPPYAPPKPRSPWGWIVALVAIGLFGAMFLGFLLIGRSFSNRERRNNPPPPPVVAAQPGETSLGEEGASVSSRETVITKSFTLTAASRFSINNQSGEVNIEGWDQPQAEVRVIKRGGSRSDRSGTQVFYTEADGNLKFRTGPPRGRGVEVRYEVKLPRTLKLVSIDTVSGNITMSDLKSALAINTTSGDIQLSDIVGDITLNAISGDIALSEASGKIAVNTTSGSIALNDIVGAVRSNTTSGDMKIVFEGVTAGEPLEFNATNGDVDIEFKSPVNADLDAETVRGDIEIDEEFQIPIEKKTGGQTARGRIGTGGQRLKINTVNGDVKVTRAE